MKITLDHLAIVRGFSARPGFCRRGARQWFRQQGLDWDSFRKDGIDAEVLLATGDAFAIAIVAAAKEEANGR